MTLFRRDRGGRRGAPAVLLLVTALMSALATDAAAAGYYLPMRGVRPAGRAGAVAVSGGGPHALWYNPAQLRALEGSHVLVDLAVIAFDSSFLRRPRQEPNGDILVYEAVENEALPTTIPNILGVTDFGLDEWAFALGLMAPYGVLSTYPVEGPQRYVLIQNTESVVFTAALGVAYQPTDWFRVGASFQSVYVSNRTVLTASAFQGLFGRPEDLDLDIRFRIDAVDAFNPMGNLGFWFQLAEGLELGVTGQLGGRIDDEDARLTVRLPTNAFFDNAELEGDTVAASLNLAPMLRAGLRYVHPFGDVELNVTWEGWSVHDELRADPGVLVLTGIFGIDEFRVGALDVRTDWEDTWAVSLGSDFIAVPERLHVRAGFVWEQGAIPANRFSVFQWDVDKVAPSLGVSVLVPEANLTIDLAYSHFFLVDQPIDDSLVEQVNPTFREGAVIVGNGDYAAAVNLFGVGLEAAF